MRRKSAFEAAEGKRLNSMDQIPETAIRWLAEGREVALATVVRTWGSAPRPVGAQLVVAEDQAFEGSVSGGCVENAVIFDAIDAMKTGSCKLLKFGVSDVNAFEVGLACGGEIEVLVEPVGMGDGPTTGELEELVKARSERSPVIWEVNTSDWSRRLIERNDAKTDLSELFRTDKSQWDGSIFRAVHNPPLRLAIIGAVHIAQPLVKIAKLAGFDVALVDPREGFASQSRFPHETFLEGWPDDALRDWGLDARTGIVALSHDPKIDHPALKVAIRSDAFYIGALGSKRTQEKRRNALAEAGFSPQEIARIDGPVGLDIGAMSPAEIAVSIMAELVERLRRPDARPGGSL